MGQKIIPGKEGKEVEAWTNLLLIPWTGLNNNPRFDGLNRSAYDTLRDEFN